MHWRFQLAGLADQFRVIAWNAPGYVLSDAFKTDRPGCKDFADALEISSPRSSSIASTSSATRSAPAWRSASRSIILAGSSRWP
jgi:pimeloyl-ACP methyl ester carboxylesterase